MANIKLINLKKDKGVPFDLYIGRKNMWLGLEESKWHNPHPMKNEGSRPLALARYEEYVRSRPDLIAALPELEGKTLACYCVPKRCHGNILIELYEEFVVGKKS